MRDFIGDRSIYDLLEERHVAYGDKTFLVFEDREGAVREYSDRDIFESVERCATGLHLAGVGQGDFVLIHLSNCPEFIITFFAISKLGAVLVPSNVANTAPEINHLVEVSKPVLAITEARYLATVREGLSVSERPISLIVARDQANGTNSFASLLNNRGHSPRPHVSGDDLCELIFTSGTSSKPKAVMLTQANCLHSGLHAVNCLWLEDGERCLTSLPLFHVNAQAMSLFAALTVGGTFVLLEEFRATKFWEQVRSHRATQTCLVAMQLRTVLAQEVSPRDSEHFLRRLFYAINVSDAEKQEFEERFDVSLINGYGCSEAMTLLACSPVLGDRRWPSVGRPAVGRRIFLLDEDGNEVAVGEVGEVVVEGTPGRDLMLGYYGDPAETDRALKGGRFFTGDSAYCDESGFLFFVDRKKNMIKRAGENIAAAEVEAAITQHGSVIESCVVGVPDPIRDEAVVALVVLEPGSCVTSEDLVQYCLGQLSKFKVPSFIFPVSELPKTSIGKIKRDQVLQLVMQLMSEEPSYG